MKVGAISIILFALMILAQWYVPLNMIIGQERILQEGKIYKFKVMPIDPNDPFRGKYIWLNYEVNQANIEVSDATEWPDEWDFRSKPAFATIQTDSAGFVRFSDISPEKPSGLEYMKVNVRYYDAESKTAHVDIPFDRYYMEESKAPEAESYYNNAISSQTHNFSPKPAWVEIAVYQGEAALKGLYIEGKSIEDCVKDMPKATKE